MEAILERPNYECLLFDLDDTLYPFSAGINLACRKNIQGNATNMALLRGWRLAVDDVVLDLEKRKQILQWNTSTSLVVSSLFGTVLLLEKYYKACCNMHSMKPEADNQFVPHLGHMSRDQ